MMVRHNIQGSNGHSERFTSTGKERDEETGYGYFGARYMDYELTSMWLSVDPMSDKYPSISPYAYCAWNPVKLVDPDGREITKFQGVNGEELANIHDGSNAVFILTDQGKSSEAYFMFQGYDESQGGRNYVNFSSLIDFSEEYARNTYTNDNNGSKTYCNFGAYFVAKSFISGAMGAGYDVPNIDFLNNKVSEIYKNIPSDYLLSDDAEATRISTETKNGQHLNLVFACTSSHIIVFTIDGKYSNIGGRDGNSVQKYHWMKDKHNEVKYFSLSVMKYVNRDTPYVRATPTTP